MFAAINYINCSADYRERFEELFRTRARAIDRMPGFQSMRVLRPQKNGDSYLILSLWDSEEQFRAWTASPEFAEGHRRGFEDLRQAKAAGRSAPMTSEFRTYEVVAE